MAGLSTITILKGLEPCEGKPSSTVLRGANYGNVIGLPDNLLSEQVLDAAIE